MHRQNIRLVCPGAEKKSFQRERIINAESPGLNESASILKISSQSEYWAHMLAHWAVFATGQPQFPVLTHRCCHLPPVNGLPLCLFYVQWP